MHLWRLGLPLLMLAACGGRSNVGDAAVADAADVGNADATSSDSEDSGAQDSGLLDVVLPTCVDDEDAIYAIVAEDFPDARAGQVLGCVMQDGFTVADLERRVTADGVTVTSGAERYLIAYATERRPGERGVGTAALLIPDAAAADGAIVVASHGNAGLADACAPSRAAAPSPELTLPWVASGLVTIAPDYAGLGNPGIQGIGDAFDTSQSVLDAARAAMQWVGENRSIVLAGHSQGAGATMNALGHAPSYAPELTISYAIAIAGGSAVPLEFAPATAPLLGVVPIGGGAGSVRAGLAQVIYADLHNRLDATAAESAFHEDIRATILDSLETDCFIVSSLRLATPATGYTPPRNFGQLVAPDFLAGLQACVADDAGCTESAHIFLEQREERATIPPSGGNVLFIGAEEDTIATPEAWTCGRQAAIDAGVTAQSCFVAGEDHFTIVPASIGTAIGAVFDGTVTCPASATTIPECTR